MPIRGPSSTASAAASMPGPVMLPLVLFVSALQTFVAAFAKTFREAQTQLGLLQLVPVVPVQKALPFHFVNDLKPTC